MLRSLLILGPLAFVGCGSNSSAPPSTSSGSTFQGSYPIKVVTTTGMVADLVREVGASHVVIEQLFGADIDPHLYKATPGDVRTLKRAEIIFYSGLHLEGKMTEVFDSLGRTVPVIAVANKLDDKKVLHDEDNAHDPHVWFDVTLWSEAAGVVRDALIKFDPKNSAEYKANCDRYQTVLSDLHAYAKARLAEVPAKQRVLVTSHDAFQYLGRAYEVEVKGIQGISTDSEASVGHITELVNFIVERKVKAVFVETSVNKRNMEALIEGCRARGHMIRLGGELFSDAMGAQETKEGTYVGMIRHNVETIVNALK